MKITYDMSGLEWSLTGWIPYLWKLFRTVETGHTADAHAVVPAVVPGSVQEALRRAGRIPDWTKGLKWLKAGEIEGMIFLCNNIMDKNLKAVEWTREWIARVGNEKLK
jgi:hypothetical protein